jgi:hypothetical protein
LKNYLKAVLWNDLILGYAMGGCGKEEIKISEQQNLLPQNQTTPNLWVFSLHVATHT